MKLPSFFSISQYVLITLQAVFLGVGLIGAVLFLFTSDRNTFAIDMPGIVLEEQNLAKHSGTVAVTSLNSNMQCPVLMVDRLKLVVRTTDYVGYRIWLAVYVLGLGLLAVTGLEQVKKIVASAGNGTPFQRSNAKRMYLLAAVLYGLPLIEFLTTRIIRSWMLAHFEFSGLTVTATYPNSIGWIVAATLVMTLGKVFEHGIRMKKDQDLTI